MGSQIFSRSEALNNIPYKKLEEYLNKIDSSEIDDLRIKNIKKIAINRYYESNIPVEYWSLKMEKDFKGSQILLEKYQEYTKDLPNKYKTGESFCLAGTNGIGKTMVNTCILKKACEQGFTSLYTTLSDIVNVFTSANTDVFKARKELYLVDFLVIDEFDNRFINSDNSSNLYARTLEGVFRTRISNKLPTLMCTNSPNILESFNGALKISLDSLMSGYVKTIPIIGKDVRKNG